MADFCRPEEAGVTGVNYALSLSQPQRELETAGYHDLLTVTSPQREPGEAGVNEMLTLSCPQREPEITLMTLPPEIRNRIAKIALTRSTPIRVLARRCRFKPTSRSLTRVSRQLRAETLGIFYSFVFFLFDINDFNFDNYYRFCRMRSQHGICTYANDLFVLHSVPMWPEDYGLEARKRCIESLLDFVCSEYIVDFGSDFVKRLGTIDWNENWLGNEEWKEEAHAITFWETASGLRKHGVGMEIRRDVLRSLAEILVVTHGREASRLGEKVRIYHGEMGSPTNGPQKHRLHQPIR